MNTNGKGSYRVINEASDYADFWEEHFGGYDYESLGINGTMYDVVAHEYDAAGGLVTEKPLGDIKNEGGESKSVVANKLSAKVQISFILAPKGTEPEFDYTRVYMPIVSLEKGKKTEIKMTDYTWLETHPSTKSTVELRQIKDLLK